MLWTYQNHTVEEIPEGYIGFVYLITNLTTGQKYIGKKLAQFKRTKPPLKGKKLKRRSVVGSEMCIRDRSKAEMSYLEAREQFERRVLESDEYYNGIINVRVGGSAILRQRLQEQAQAQSTV